MRARLVAFPIRGRNWCFSRAIDHSTVQSSSGDTPSTVRELWKKISSKSQPINANAELLVDFISNKMNNAWMGLEKAPQGTIKNKIHGLGLRLLSRVKASEIFLKSISNEVNGIHVTYPASLDPRLVRRRLRHIAMRGTIIHKKYLYGSVTLLPVTSALAILPLPNVPFFWVLFRTYSHWRALQGSKKLLQLVSNDTQPRKLSIAISQEGTSKNGNSKFEDETHAPELVFQPSEELKQFLLAATETEGLSESAVSEICKCFNLNKVDVLKYKSLV